jgi:Protein of unknown function (DUF1638)
VKTSSGSPDDKLGAARARVLILACGALAREIAALRAANDWSGVVVRYLAPELHNRPERIPEAVERVVRETAGEFDRIIIGYADCGTTGGLDEAIGRLRGEFAVEIERIPGVHCYEFYAGSDLFAALSDAEPGTFYLTDFLVRHFDRLVIRGLGIDRHPELHVMYFGNYRRVVYLGQKATAADQLAAEAIARRMNLDYEFHRTGYGGLGESLAAALPAA